MRLFRRCPTTEILSKVFTLAVEYSVTTDNPCRKVKKLHVNIWVPNSKTGRDYPIPLGDAVRDVMRRHCEGKSPDDYVFVNPETGKPYVDLKKAFRKACELAGIKGYGGMTCATPSARGSHSWCERFRDTGVDGAHRYQDEPSLRTPGHGAQADCR